MYETKQSVTSVYAAFEQATGTIDYRFTNDYMFHAILQKNETVLRALICSLLHLKSDDIRSIRITNPIELGEAMDDKEYILDITILMNDNTFLDFTPFEEAPEFYATYKLLNVKNHRLYSDKFILNVVDLTQIDLATDEDKAYQVDRWARLFKTTTWEELKMIAKNDNVFLEAAQTLYSLNADETIRAQCRAREDYDRLHNTINHKINKLEEENKSLTTEVKSLATENETLTTENESLTTENKSLTTENETLKKLLQEQGIPYPRSNA
jgi:FtsZ-binding cell division protein ZapB